LRRRFARFNLSAHFLETCGKRVNLLLLECDGRFLFLYVTPVFLILAVLFEELIPLSALERWTSTPETFPILHPVPGNCTPD
jgi:hypothetical protein